MPHLGSWLRNSGRRPPRELTATASRIGHVATELRRDTRDVGVVQRMLGHEGIHTTEAYLEAASAAARFRRRRAA